MKKFLSIIFGFVWIALIPLYILASILICLFTDVSMQGCLKFWGVCAFASFSGEAFDEYDITQWED